MKEEAVIRIGSKNFNRDQGYTLSRVRGWALDLEQTQRVVTCSEEGAPATNMAPRDITQYRDTRELPRFPSVLSGFVKIPDVPAAT